jgi:hypothetical protein
VRGARTLETEWRRLQNLCVFPSAILGKDDLTLDVSLFLDRTRGWAGNAFELDIGGAYDNSLYQQAVDPVVQTLHGQSSR